MPPKRRYHFRVRMWAFTYAYIRKKREVNHHAKPRKTVASKRILAPSNVENTNRRDICNLNKMDVIRPISKEGYMRLIRTSLGIRRPYVFHISHMATLIADAF